MSAALKRVGLLNIIVIAVFLILGAMIVVRVVTTPSALVTTSQVVAPMDNPIVLENQKQGTDAWKSPNYDSYLKNLAEDDKRRAAIQQQAPAASDSGGVPGWLLSVVRPDHP